MASTEEILRRAEQDIEEERLWREKLKERKSMQEQEHTTEKTEDGFSRPSIERVTKETQLGGIVTFLRKLEAGSLSIDEAHQFLGERLALAHEGYSELGGCEADARPHRAGDDMRSRDSTPDEGPGRPATGNAGLKPKEG